MTFDDIVKTLNFIKPNAEWALRGDSLNDLEWIDELQTKPTQEELETGFSQYNSWKTEQDTAKAQAKASAQAKLAALGLTADDLQALGL